MSYWSEPVHQSKYPRNNEEDVEDLMQMINTSSSIQTLKQLLFECLGEEHLNEARGFLQCIVSKKQKHINDRVRSTLKETTLLQLRREPESLTQEQIPNSNSHSSNSQSSISPLNKEKTLLTSSKEHAVIKDIYPTMKSPNLSCLAIENKSEIIDPFDKLSLEILLHLCGFFDAQTLCRFTQTCKKFYNLVKHNSILWKNLFRTLYRKGLTTRLLEPSLSNRCNDEAVSNTPSVCSAMLLPMNSPSVPPPINSPPINSPPSTTSVPSHTPKRSQVSKACSNCRSMHAACGLERPCNRCIDNGLQNSCHDIPRKKRVTRKRHQPDSTSSIFPKSQVPKFTPSSTPSVHTSGEQSSYLLTSMISPTYISSSSHSSFSPYSPTFRFRSPQIGESANSSNNSQRTSKTNLLSISSILSNDFPPSDPKLPPFQ